MFRVLGLHRDNGEEKESTVIEGQYMGYIGLMEEKMETTIQGLGFWVWGYISYSLHSFKGDYIVEHHRG